jgi:hypothetical protein
LFLQNKDVIDKNLMDKIKKLYLFYDSYVNVDNLIPIFFDHKIADADSTIDLILIKGQVLDNPKKYMYLLMLVYIIKIILIRKNLIQKL